MTSNSFNITTPPNTGLINCVTDFLSEAHCWSPIIQDLPTQHIAHVSVVTVPDSQTKEETLYKYSNSLNLHILNYNESIYDMYLIMYLSV